MGSAFTDPCIFPFTQWIKIQNLHILGDEYIELIIWAALWELGYLPDLTRESIWVKYLPGGKLQHTQNIWCKCVTHSVVSNSLQPYGL